LDEDSAIEMDHGRVTQITPQILRNALLSESNVLQMQKNILLNLKDHTFRKQITSQLFCTEARHKLPSKLILNQEVASLLVRQLILKVVRQCKTKGIAVFVSWMPKFTLEV
jgi:hypothetical protein